METPPNAAAAKEFLVTGVSRSGRVRKKSSKLLDFQSPEDVEKKPKRTPKTGRSGTRGGRLSALSARGRKAFDEIDAEDLDDDVEAIEQVTSEGSVNNAVTASANSDDELDELVADLVEGVEAESIEQANNNNESKVRQSLYMTEKANKRKMLKDGRVITGKMERKDKGKARFTAYSLWAREFRKSSKFSKTQDLGELWANVSNKEKSAWRRKAKIQATKAKAREKLTAPATPVSTTNSLSNNNSFLNRATTSRTKKLAAERQKTPPPQPPPSTPPTKMNSTKNSVGRKRNNSNNSPSSRVNVLYALTGDVKNSSSVSSSQLTASALSNSQVALHKTQLPSIEAIDAAAHLKLLGESLTIIGERLKEHEGQIAVSGSLSVLLDSLLCSLGPLLCLTTHIPGLEKKPQLSANLAATLDNIAYVMPGL